MIFSTQKSDLLKSVGHCVKIIDKKSPLPILNQLMIKTSDEGLFLSATDMDLGILCKIPASISDHGTICVSGHLLFEILKKLPDGSSVNFKFNNERTQLIVDSGRSKFSIACMDSQNFPELIQSEYDSTFMISAEILKDMIDSTQFCASHDETKYNMSGIYFHSVTTDHGEKIRTVASDLCRLACCEYDAPEGSQGMPQVILSKKTVSEVGKLIESTKSEIQISLSSAKVEFVVKDERSEYTFISRNIDASYPSYESALELKSDQIITADRKQFSECVDRVSIVVATDKVNVIKLFVCQNEAKLSAVSQDIGSAQEEIEVDFPYDNAIEVCFNSRFFYEITQQIKETEVEVMITDGDESCIIIKPVNNTKKMYVLMPMDV